MICSADMEAGPPLRKRDVVFTQRFLLALLSSFGFANVYLMRVNLSGKACPQGAALAGSVSESLSSIVSWSVAPTPVPQSLS